MRRRTFKVAITTYVYYHTQVPGYQVRKKWWYRGRLYDHSKFFSEGRHGSLEKAERLALRYKRDNSHIFSR